MAFTQKGSYYNFPCLDCGDQSAIRSHGEKKNVSYCPKCKAGSNIISIAMKVKGLEFQEAKDLLIEKTSLPDKPIEEELNLIYQLEWCEEMEKLQLNEELCHTMQIGRPKGKTMLSKYIVFTVFNEQAVKVAYFGMKPDGTTKYHHSFNPESYLYNYQGVDPTEEVCVTNDMFECLRMIHGGKQSVCNFGLPYLSLKQYQLLSELDKLVFVWLGDKRDIAYSNVANLKTFSRFA